MDRTLHLCFVVVLLGRLGPRSVKGNPACEYPKQIFGVQLENWNHIRNWNSLINNLTSPTDGQSYIQTLDLSRDQRLENIGRRMRTYFLAPETGTYRFYITCDDKCQLKLSTDEKLENVVTLVTVRRWTRYKQWTRLNSARVSLSKGRSYLLEAILFQGPGNYHMTVRVDLPDGNISAPISNKFLVKYAPAGSFGAAPEGDWGAWSQCSKTCGEGTQTRNRSCLNLPPVYHNPSTTNMEMRVCYPITPCCLPRSIIQVRNISSTSLLVEWQDRWLQELRQFQIIYNRTTNETSQSITVNSSQQSVELRGLGFFTWYCVRVLVTRQGVDQLSPCVYARTGQDVPCGPPSGLEARNLHSSFRVKVAWQALSEACWRGVPRGYSIRLQVDETAHEKSKIWRQEFSVRSNSTKAVLEGLQTYTRYGLQVAAVTERGMGPYSEAVYVETCRCPRRIFVNWMHVSPLCVKRDEEEPTGLVPEVLRHMVLHGCGSCHENNTTKIIYHEESHSVQHMISTVNEDPQINLPITVRPGMPSAGDGWVFLPMVEVAGFAFLTRKPSTDVYARYLASSVLVRWPVLVMLFVLFVTFGLAVWTVEKYKNPAYFPQRFTRGWNEGVWWAFISMTTVGYGDRYPKSVPGRLIGIVSFLVGAVLNALFIAILTY